MGLYQKQKLAFISLILCFSIPGCNQQATVDSGGSGKANNSTPAVSSSSTSQPEFPVFELEEISFADPELKKTTRAFHDYAESIAGDDWFVQPYLRRSSALGYQAKWQTSEVHSWSSFHRSVLPHHSLVIELKGPGLTDGVEKTDSLQVSGRWVPTKGWAAAINYKPRGNGGFTAVTLVQQNDSQAHFSDTLSATNFRLTGLFAEATVLEDRNTRYQYETRQPVKRQPEDRAKHTEKFLNLFKSPESLRDSLLVDIAELRRIAGDQIPRLENVAISDLTHVRSDNPARKMPATFRPPSEATKTKLLDQVMTQLDAIEKSINENHQEIHAAITKALPLKKLNMLPWGQSVTDGPTQR